MTKEEQIREIIIEIHPCYIYQADPSPREIAKQIYESGYRKADEVRKETAREILQKIKAFPRDWIHSYQKGAIILREAEINQIATEFGVEVEE